MGVIGNTLGGLVGIGADPGKDTYGAGVYGQDYSSLLSDAQSNLDTTNANQTGLANQYAAIASGQGPNPAQAMLNQSTGQNVANQASLMAGQRGASQNVGMMARQAGQQGAKIQQQAAGQGASMQAQQQLGALGQQAGVYAQQGTQDTSQLGAYESAINGANQINASSAASRAQYGQGMGGGLINGIGQMLAGGGEVKSYADGGSTGSGNSFVGQFLSGLGSEMSSGVQSTKPKKGSLNLQQMLHGLNKSNAAAGDPTANATSIGANDTYNPALTTMGNEMAGNAGMAAGNAGMAGGDVGGAGAASAGEGAAAADEGGGSLLELAAAKGGRIPEKVKAKVSPGEGWIPPEKAKAVAKGSLPPEKALKVFPGKPKVKGDSYKNDVLKRDLPQGGFVIPNSVMQSKDPVKGAADFVRDMMRKKGKTA